MTFPFTKHLADQRGATLPLVALSLVALLSAAALAVDLGLLINAHAEAQRAADSGALAGASAYMDAVPDAAVAQQRALEFATQNQILGQQVHAPEVTVSVDDPNWAVTVQVMRDPLPLFFARVFGRRAANVAASATARVRNSGTSSCIKPFGIPDGAYGEEDVGTRVLLWESKGNGQDDVGESNFLIVGNPESPAGVGRDIYNMLVDASCEFPQVEVGGEVPAQPSNNARGNTMTAIRDIVNDAAAASGDGWDGILTWSPDGPYDGFNRPDWSTDPRVGVVPVYDPATFTPSGTFDVTVTGFVRVMVESVLVDCQNGGSGNRPPCADPNVNGVQKQLYAIILPAAGIPDNCVGTGCAELLRSLQLIR